MVYDISWVWFVGWKLAVLGTTLAANGLCFAGILDLKSFLGVVCGMDVNCFRYHT